MNDSMHPMFADPTQLGGGQPDLPALRRETLRPRAETLFPFDEDTELCRFLPMPVGLFRFDLSYVAMLLYTLLLDRCTLSQKNHWKNRQGWLYVVFPVEALTKLLRASRSTVQRGLKELEDQELILRTHPIPGGASLIFLRVPSSSVSGAPQDPKYQDPRWTRDFPQEDVDNPVESPFFYPVSSMRPVSQTDTPCVTHETGGPLW